MKIRTILLVLLAILCGSAAAVGVNQLSSETLVNKEVEMVPILVAARNLPGGVTVTDKFVVVQEWPKGTVPEGAITTMADAIDRALLTPLVKNEPVMDAKLASREAGRGMAARIPKGMRAFTISTPHVAAVGGGFILPGNKVDVLLTTITSDSRDPSGGGVTTTLLQNVEVMAVAQTLDSPAENKVDPKETTHVTLMVTPDQAAKLDLGTNKGVLHLALRNPEDILNADTRPATMADLRFHQEGPAGDAEPKEPAAAAPPPPAAPQYSQIRTLKGSTAGVVNILQSN